MAETPNSKGKNVIKNLAFFGGIGAVLAVAFVLAAQGGARPMPSRHPEHGTPHQLRFNLKGDLIGVETDPPVDPATATQPGFVLEKKVVEKRVNEGCQSCHATLPEHHPPKTECIKCHRMEKPKAP
jgi:hypothetical protein